MAMWQTETSLHKVTGYKVWIIQVFYFMKYKSLYK